MRLLPRLQFAPIFEPLRGRRVGVVDGIGNVGDQIIYAATRQLLTEFGIDWLPQTPQDRDPVDLLLLFGGGNLGSCYAAEVAIRRQALTRGLPAIVLPQSLMGPEPGPFTRVYIRERLSLQYCPEGILAPDLALGFEYDAEPPQPVQPRGVFLRRDAERRQPPVPGATDPARLCRTPAEYLALAATCAEIVTDRLHFAICGLLNRRRVTLLPNSYHKNRGMWETWLADLGCLWANDLPSALSGG